MLPSVSSLSRATTTGWIGLGAMGHHMAINLFTKTLAAHQSTSPSSTAGSGDLPSFVICEQDDGRAGKFMADIRNKGGVELSQRVQRLGSGKEVAASASRIMTMLPSTPQVEAVYLDSSSGILAGLPTSPETEPLSHEIVPPMPSDAGSASMGASESISMSETPSTSSSSSSSSPSSAGLASIGGDRPHTLLIDGTTLDPTAAVKIAKRVQDETHGKAVMLDAPVSGGIVAAEAGTLTIMFGSPSPLATALAVPLLARMAREGGVVPCGANGTGVAVKVCNNLILAINQIGLAEGLALGKSLGVDPLLLHNVINTSSGQSWSSRVNSPLPEVPNSPGSRNYSGGFQSRLMLKDVGLALHAAHEYDLPTPLTWASKAVYEAVCAEGDGDMAGKDFRTSVVLEWLRLKQEQGVERGWKDTPSAGQS